MRGCCDKNAWWKWTTTCLAFVVQLLMLLCVTGLHSIAQTTTLRDECGAYSEMQYKLKTVPGYADSVKAFDRRIRAGIEAARTQHTDPDLLTIPVVFHIVWNEPWENFPEQIIQTQLAQLNNDFNALNYDLVYTPTAFKPLIGNMKIKFVLAQTDPNGNPTTGIRYIHTATTWNPQFGDNPAAPKDNYMKKQVKGGDDAWDIKNYLNIWVCDIGQLLNGFATSPYNGLDFLEDGVVISSRAFGVHFQNRPESNFGRTLVHEVGHWLGLKHIWGDDDWDQNATQFCIEDDEVDDTPKQPKRTTGVHNWSFKVADCNNTPAGCMWMNYMDYVGHLNRIMFSKGQVERARTVLTTIRASLLESPGLKPPIFNTGNAPFRSAAFTSIAVGKGGYIWAGTNLFGLYKFDNNGWRDVLPVDNRDIRQIVPDKLGGIWVAQMGHDGDRGIAGGINYFSDTTNSSMTYIAPSSGLSSRLTRGVFADTSRPANGFNIWTANIPEKNFIIQNEEVVEVYNGGGVSYKAFGQPFDTLNQELNVSPIAPKTHVCKAIGGNTNEVWVFDDAIIHQPRIVRYNAASKAVIMPTFTPSNTNNALPPDFLVNSIHFDAFGNKWIGLENGGVAYANSSNSWQKLTLPAALFPDVAVNAIVSDKEGNIFIGTSQGLVVLNQGMIGNTASYKLLRIEDNLPSDNVTALAIDTLRKAIVVATDDGICILQKNCILSSCEYPPPTIAYTIKNGNWNDPTVWSNGQVPACGSVVVIQNNVSVTAGANTGSLNLISGQLRLEAGVQLFMCNGN